MNHRHIVLALGNQIPSGFLKYWIWDNPNKF